MREGKIPYAGWLEPDFPLLELGYEPPKKSEVIIIPEGIEVIACFNAATGVDTRLLALYITEKGHTTFRARLRKSGLYLNQDKRVTLETALQEHEQRQIYHAPEKGVGDIERPTFYATMQLHSAVDYVLELMRQKEGPTAQPRVLRSEQVEEFRASVQGSFSVRPFHLSGAAIYYTTAQTELVRREFIAKYGQMPSR